VEYALALFVLVVVVGLIVARPLLRGAADPRHDAERQELEAAKEAKYREIRDAELDLRMGKLSEADWHATDRELRAEAIEILRELDALEGRDPERPLP
jgi:hypothetical protein